MSTSTRMLRDESFYLYRDWDAWLAYGQTCTCSHPNILFCVVFLQNPFICALTMPPQFVRNVFPFNVNSTSTHLYIIFRHCHCFHKTKYFCSLDYTNCSLVIKIKITITYNLISLLKELEYERTEESIHGYEYVFLRAQLMVIIIMCLSVLVSPAARFSHGL